MRISASNSGYVPFRQSMALYNAAREIARNPDAIDNREMQKSICAKYGIAYDKMTDKERKNLNKFIGGKGNENVSD